jgi:hypothetical protein
MGPACDAQVNRTKKYFRSRQTVQWPFAGAKIAERFNKQADQAVVRANRR